MPDKENDKPVDPTSSDAVKEDIQDMYEDLVGNDEKGEDEKDDDKSKEDESKDKDKSKEEDDEHKEDESNDKEDDDDKEKQKEDDKDESEEDKVKDKDKDKEEEPSEVLLRMGVLEQQLGDLVKATKAKDVEKVDEKKEEILESMEFISKDTDMEDFLSSPDKLNELLNKAANFGYQQAIKSTPALTKKLVTQQVTLDKAVAQFFDDSPDLLPIRDYVGTIANAIVSEEPDLPISDVLKETEKRVRTALKIEKKAEEVHKDSKDSKGENDDEKDDDDKDKKKTKVTPFAKKGAGKGGKGKSVEDTRTEKEVDIDEVLSVA